MRRQWNREDGATRTARPQLPRAARRTRAMIAIGLATALALKALDAGASDGLLEINQACVAVGCFAGDTADFPVTTQAWKSYVLTSDVVISSPDTNAIQLGEGATLDLRGFSIRGPVTCTGTPAICTGTGKGVGVSAGPGRNAVRNGSIVGVGAHAIYASGGFVAESLRLSDNGADGIRYGLSNGADTGVVRNCMIVRNGGIGININYGSARGLLVEGNVIAGNGSDGIRGNGALVRGNRVSANGGLGLNAAFGGEGTAFGDNAFFNNNGGGVNPQTSGGVQLGVNVCRTGTTCP